MEAPIAILVSATVGTQELAVDAACDLPFRAEDDLLFAETVDTVLACAAVVGFAAFVAVHALDRDVGGWPEDATELILWTKRDTRIDPGVTDFAR